MDCKTCDALLDDYKHVVELLRNAVQDGQGAVGADSSLTAKIAADLGEMCKDANHRLMEHWREEHGGLAPKGGSS